MFGELETHCKCRHGSISEWMTPLWFPLDLGHIPICLFPCQVPIENSLPWDCDTIWVVYKVHHSTPHHSLAILIKLTDTGGRWQERFPLDSLEMDLLITSPDSTSFQTIAENTHE